MTRSFVHFLRRWCSWALRRVRSRRVIRFPRFLRLTQLEDRTAPAFFGGMTVASGDLNRDGITDVVTGAWTGGGPHVRAVSGADGTELHSFFAYTPIFRGGVNVAVRDVTGDGTADIVTGAGPGGGPHVKVFDGVSGDEVRSFFAFDPGFRGGASVAAGDVNRDGFAEVVVGAGVGGNPHVKVFDGRTGIESQSFLAYSPDFRGGVSVAVGDVTGMVNSIW